VTTQDGEQVTGAELIEWVRDRIAHFKAPHAVHFAQLPKTSTGKILKTDLRNRVRNSPDYSAGRLADDRGPNDRAPEES
jgi:fatty-acyl-CoA synthase